MVGDGNRGLSGHLLFVDALNIVSAFAVVLLHCSITAFWLPIGSMGWFAGVLSQAIAIFAVPIFFMVSGMNLLGYRERYDTATFFRRRFLRVGVNLFVGSVAIYALYCLFPQSFYGAWSLRETMGIGDFARRFLTNDICDVYWFLYAIACLYVATPLLSKLSSNKRMMQCILGLTFLAGMAVPFARDAGLLNVAVPAPIAWMLFMSSNLFYFVVGFYVSRYPIKPLADTRILVCLLVGSTTAMVLFSVIENGVFAARPAEAYDSFAVGTTDPLCALQALALFCLFRRAEPLLQERRASLAAPLRIVSAACLYIYMAHMVVIDWMSVNLSASLDHVLNCFPPLRALAVFAVTATAVILCQTVFRCMRRRGGCPQRPQGRLSR